MLTLQDIPLITGALLACGAFVLAAVSDVRRYLIPNRLCVAVALGYGLAGASLPPTAMLDGLAVGAGVLVLGAILFARGLVGGGDVKLAAAASLWAGTASFSDFALATSLSGAALAAFMLSSARRLLPAPPQGDAQQGFGQPMPFGVPLAVGGLTALALQLNTSL